MQCINIYKANSHTQNSSVNYALLPHLQKESEAQRDLGFVRSTRNEVSVPPVTNSHFLILASNALPPILAVVKTFSPPTV